MQDIERRIADWTHLPKENGEHFYLIRYEVGQEYKPHQDYFHGGLEGESGTNSRYLPFPLCVICCYLLSRNYQMSFILITCLLTLS